MQVSSPPPVREENLTSRGRCLSFRALHRLLGKCRAKRFSQDEAKNAQQYGERRNTMQSTRRHLFKLAGGAALLSGLSAVQAAVPRSSIEKFDEQYDVVIVGSGFAGLTCALRCAEKNYSVLLIEKMTILGGNSLICGGNFACPGNPNQKKLGIKDSREIFIGDCTRDGLGINHVELLDVIYDRCNDVVALLRKYGCTVDDSHLGISSGHTAARIIESTTSDGSCYVLPMLKALKGMKNVTIMNRTKMDSFVIDDTGRVAGIAARTKYSFNSKLASDDADNTSGEQKFYGAKRGVMLAAGGFSRDTWFRQMQDPRVQPTMDSTNQPGATAGALTAALDIGAAPIQISWLQFLPSCNPDEPGYGISANFIEHACYRYGIIVNPKTGKRFVNELAGRQPKTEAMFAVIGKDENYPVAIGDSAAAKAVNPAFLTAPLEKKTVKVFNSIDELADFYKIDRKALRDTIEQYNAAVKSGKDKAFGKPMNVTNGIDLSKPPFYAGRVCPKIHHTMGGVLISPKGEVIHMRTHKPIPGLYAGGEVTGGVHGASRLGTVGIIDALTFGMVAGENI